MQSEKERWISSRERMENPRMRLFCLPHAGGGASAYQSWRRSVPASVEVCPLRLPGRETRIAEPAHTRCSDLVAEVAEVVAAECDRPYAIFGHSMGAVIAYELAQRLVAMGVEQPAGLFLSGRIAAHLKLPAKPLHGLPQMAFLSELNARYDGLPREVVEDPDMLDYYLPILRADLTLIETYQYDPKPPLACPIMVTGGLSDKSIWLDGLEAWRQHTTGSLSLHRFEGGHFYLAGESKAQLLELLKEQLTCS